MGRDSWRGSEAGQFRRDRVPLGRSRSGRKWGPSSFGSLKDAPERGRLPAPRAPAGLWGAGEFVSVVRSFTVRYLGREGRQGVGVG